MVGLFKRAHAEHVYFLFGEEAPVAALHVLLGEAGEVHAVELRDVVAEAFEDAAHVAVAAAMDFDADLLLVGGAGVFDGVGLDVAVFERDAFGDLVEVGCRGFLSR